MQYNLLDQSWIPCLGPGRQITCRSLRETLARAPDILEIADPSPLVTVALHRVLIAILHRAHNGPATEDHWRGLWEHGGFDIAMLDRYLTPLHDRFDLFDPAHPFYQTAGIHEAHGRGMANLVHELAMGNNTTLFDHTNETRDIAFSPDRAARQLVALQVFAVGGLVTYDDKAHKSADAAPLAKGAVALVKGENLFQTLLLNMLLYDPKSDLPFACSGPDLPAWEQDDPVVPIDRRPAGYLDWLTWQSRRVHLFPVEGPDGAATIRKVAILKGYQLPGGAYRKDYETMVSFFQVLKPTAGQDPWPALGFREDRALWRDSLPLFHRFQESSESHRGQWPPRTLAGLSHLLPDQEQGFPLDMYGLVTDKASVLLWRQERLTVPLRYLSDEGLYSRLREGLEEARRTHQALQAGMEALATMLLAPEADLAHGRQPDPEARKQLVEHLGAGRIYWSRLDGPFHTLVSNLPRDHKQRPDGVIEYGREQALPAWSDAVGGAAHAAIEEITRGMDDSARVLKAGTAAWRAYYGTLKKLNSGGIAR